MKTKLGRTNALEETPALAPEETPAAEKAAAEEAAAKAAEVKHKALVKDVEKAMGASLEKLGRQPLALAGGGMESILQAACKEAAGFPDPVASAVRMVRVMCGSRAVARPVPSEK